MHFKRKMITNFIIGLHNMNWQVMSNVTILPAIVPDLRDRHLMVVARSTSRPWPGYCPALRWAHSSSLISVQVRGWWDLPRGWAAVQGLAGARAVKIWRIHLVMHALRIQFINTTQIFSYKRSFEKVTETMKEYANSPLFIFDIYLQKNTYVCEMLCQKVQ